MNGISASAAAVIAIAAAGTACLGVLLAIACYAKLRSMRRAQVVLLGKGKDDLVNFAVSLETRLEDIQRAVDELAGGLARIDRRVDGCLSRTSIVRYDA